MLGSSPRLIAANHVLHRLLTPRHSPYALSSLTKTACRVTTKAEAPNVTRLNQAVSICFPIGAGASDHGSASELESYDSSTRTRNTRHGTERIDSVFKDRAGRLLRPATAKVASKKQTHGGADRVRTDDLRLAKPALSHLSYSPQGRQKPASTRIYVASGPSSRPSSEPLQGRWWA